ncbi:hypothetical protein DL98DRAFT_584948 [Cadophora sp. DSE1049]|nr:hypothetical protein DL98DRAFT_584948 [Cadophora sp. DSE1049]
MVQLNEILDLDKDSTWESLLIDRENSFVDRRSEEAQAFNSLLDVNMPQEVLQWDCLETSGWIFELENATLEVHNPGTEEFHIQVATATLPPRVIDPLRQDLRRMISEVIYEYSSPLDFDIVLLQVLEDIVGTIAPWKEDQKRLVAVSNSIKAPWMAASEYIYRGAADVLGTSIAKIRDMLPKRYKMLHMEPVFRADLVARFRIRQDEMYEKLCKLDHEDLRHCVSGKAVKPKSRLDNQKDLARELCRPRMTFHGTQLHSIHSMVRWGFQKPGDKAGKQTVQVLCGSSFGVGIYSSPSLEFALDYASVRHSRTKSDDIPGLRLIVCATLMGRSLKVTRKATRRTPNLAAADANSHISPNKLVYIVFDSAQIIPCYVIYFDLTSELIRNELMAAPVDPAEFKAKKRKPQPIHSKIAEQQEKKAAALKWFPYGSRPATETSFVIEEIGEISDDEEDHGTYQKEWQEAETKPGRVKVGSWLNEDQSFRDI